MNKEDILKMSREENMNKMDERELYATGKASRFGIAMGGVLCMLLIFLDEFIIHDNKISLAGWMIYLGMMGAQQLVLYKHLKKKTDLFFGVGNIIIAILAIYLMLR